MMENLAERIAIKTQDNEITDIEAIRQAVAEGCETGGMSEVELLLAVREFWCRK